MPVVKSRIDDRGGIAVGDLSGVFAVQMEDGIICLAALIIQISGKSLELSLERPRRTQDIVSEKGDRRGFIIGILVLIERKIIQPQLMIRTAGGTRGRRLESRAGGTARVKKTGTQLIVGTEIGARMEMTAGASHPVATQTLIPKQGFTQNTSVFLIHHDGLAAPHQSGSLGNLHPPQSRGRIAMSKTLARHREKSDQDQDRRKQEMFFHDRNEAFHE